MVAVSPFGRRVDNDEIGDAFAYQEGGSDGNKTGVGSIGFDEDEVADNGDENVE